MTPVFVVMGLWITWLYRVRGIRVIVFLAEVIHRFNRLALLAFLVIPAKKTTVVPIGAN
jgi:hypothetical protein